MIKFQVELSGLSEFRDIFDQNKLDKQLGIALGQAGKLIHSALRSGVTKRYIFDGDLNSVLEGKSTSNLTFGKNLAEGSLTYNFKPAPLIKFDVRERTVPAISYFRDPITKRIKRKTYAKQALVRVLRSSGPKPVRSKRGFPGFVVKAGKGRRGVYARVQNKTWKHVRFGVSGIDERAPIEPLFGPSLSQMARYIWENDPYGDVKNALSKFDNLVFRAIVF